MSQDTPKFQKKNETFVCAQCLHNVPLSKSTCRDHCPRCLHSLHVDIFPGDRAAGCGGMLKPLSYSRHKKKGYMIHYQCVLCGEKRSNYFLEFDNFESDSFDALLKLSSVSS